MHTNDKANLQAMLDAAEKIAGYVAGIADADAFYGNSVVFDASLMNFITIGEMVDRLSVQFKENHPETDWVKIKAFRNLIAHDYLGIDAEEVWQIITSYLPVLKDQIGSIVESL